MMTKEQILAAKDIRVDKLHVAGWGEVFIRTMTSAEYENLFDGENIPARSQFAAVVLSDAQGNRLFTDEESGHLDGKSTHALQAIVAAGMALNALTDEAKEQLAKN